MAKQKFNDIEKILEISNNKERSVVNSLMTKYELDCVLNQRTIQLAQGSYPFISKYTKEDGIEYNINEMKITTNMELRKIAIEELKEGKLPLMVKRQYPNNTTDYIKVCDLDLTAVENLIR